MDVPADVPDQWSSVPYGFPLRNQRYRVIDARGRDCPDWVTGELWIGGVGVAAGYRADPETTRARFVELDGHRWYRTGDLGRYWPDGTLEFLGRVDQQVKIRGHRIELGEVEASLEAHPQVQQALAVVTGPRAQRRLRAFVVSLDQRLDVDRELAAFLAERLPDYAIPVRFTVVEQLPLTGNGKVDRAALNRLAEDAPAIGDYEPARGELEIRLALWEELLEVPRVGRNDEFLLLGGDSLLAIRALEAIRQRFGVRLALRDLLRGRTVAELAAAITGHQRYIDDSGPVEEGVV